MEVETETAANQTMDKTDEAQDLDMAQSSNNKENNKDCENNESKCESQCESPQKSPISNDNKNISPKNTQKSKTEENDKNDENDTNMTENDKKTIETNEATTNETTNEKMEQIEEIEKNKKNDKIESKESSKSVKDTNDSNDTNATTDTADTNDNNNNNNNSSNNDASNSGETQATTQESKECPKSKKKSKHKHKKRPHKQSSCHKRIQKELTEILLHPIEGITGGPKNVENLYQWTASVVGPKGSPYENGRFYFDIRFSMDYPFKAPKIICKTKIYHCNFDQRGNICLDILKDNWSAALTITKVLLSIVALMDDPNPEDPLNGEIAKHFLTDKNDHDREAREWTKRYAETVNEQ